MSDEAFVNASPLILLSRTGQLDLLRLAAAKVWVPEAVRLEIGVKGPADPVVKALATNEWLMPCLDRVVPDEIQARNLGAGEASVLAAAMAASATAVLDDLGARRFAESAGLRLVGTLGLVLRAKRRGVLKLVRPVLDSLLANGLYLSPAGAREILRLSGE